MSPLNNNSLPNASTTQTTVAVQDSQREIAMCAMLELTHNPQRLGEDAWDGSGNPFELKTTSKGSVSTARDLGPKTIETYRTRYWVITSGKNYASGFQSDETFFLAPEHMEGWYAKTLARFDVDIALINKVRSIVAPSLSADEIIHLNRLLNRGMKINDPQISWKYVRENGIDITADPANRLRELVVQFPLASRRASPESVLPASEASTPGA